MKPFINSLNSRRNHALYVLFILLTSAVVFSCKNDSEQKQAKAPVVDSALLLGRDSLQSQLIEARYYLDESMNKVARLDTELREKDLQIAKLNKEIKHYKNSSNTFATELKSAKKMIASLKDEVKSFKDHIASLENRNSAILADKDNLQKKYDELKELGSVLHASNIRIAALHLKHSGKEKKTARARRVNEFRMRFDIDENRIAENGTKKLYISIKGPDGNMLTNNVLGSGIMNLFNGKPVNYSIEKDIALKQNEALKDVTVDWKQEGTYEKGTYQVEIYNGTYPIGEATVALR